MYTTHYRGLTSFFSAARDCQPKRKNLRRSKIFRGFSSSSSPWPALTSPVLTMAGIGKICPKSMQPFFLLRDTDAWFGSQMKDILGLKLTKCEIYQMIFPGFREQKDSIVFGQYHRKTTTVTLFAGNSFRVTSPTSSRLLRPQRGCIGLKT